MKKRMAVLLVGLLLLVPTLGLVDDAPAGEKLLTITGFGSQATEDGGEVLTVEALTGDGEEVAFIGDAPELWVTGAEYQGVNVHRERDPNVVKEYYTMEDLILARVEYLVMPEGSEEQYVGILAPDAQFPYVMEDGIPVLVFSEDYFTPYVPEDEQAPAA